MTVILFHCTFTDRNMSGHVHSYNPDNAEYVYGACLLQSGHGETRVTGGIIVQTSVHDSDTGFIDELVQSSLRCPHLVPLTAEPFTLQPFRLPVLNTQLPLEEKNYFELMFEKYLSLAQQGSLAN